MKSLLYVTLVATMFMLSGCGDTGDSAASCRFEVQNNLDSGDFKAVIAELNQPNSACFSAYNSNEWLIDLGAAYMGESGLSMSEILTLIGGANNSANSSFSAFIDGVSQKQTSTALESLDNASNAYSKFLGEQTCSSPNLSTSSQDICLFIGLVEILRGTTTVNYLIDGDISALFDDSNPVAQNEVKQDMTASVCALEFANTGQQCSEGTVSGSNVSFIYSDNSTRNFRDLEIIINGKIYHRLATPLGVSFGTTIITDGYCDNSFANQSLIWNFPLLACPLNKDPLKNDEEVATLLVETLNSGIDAIASALSGDLALQQEVLNYKSEIDNFGNADGQLSIDEVQNYLNSL
ncbi:hypothetical protein JHD50_02685 [Sulfurimonas sp. MAG313]|nr:hypothetical protein [Sulfurimonas sp. MAG313]MDF1880217.1 hypothetical protein [Sulfurimonas sp. MAG313]